MSDRQPRPRGHVSANANSGASAVISTTAEAPTSRLNLPNRRQRNKNTTAAEAQAMGDYEVGFGRPPKHSQFQKGRSGNPKGKPKGAKSVRAVTQEVLFRPIQITMSGKKVKVASFQVVLEQLIQRAMKGDARATDKILSLMALISSFEDNKSQQDVLPHEQMASLGVMSESEIAALAFAERLDLEACGVDNKSIDHILRKRGLFGLTSAKAVDPKNGEEVGDAD